MEIKTILLLILIHWIADFVFQDEKWALGKSKNWSDLLKHTVTYSYMFMLFLSLTFVVGTGNLTFGRLMCFGITTFFCHTATDYFTSRVVSQKFEAKELGSSIPNLGAFSVIGFDQVLHYVQIFVTYQYIFGN